MDENEPLATEKPTGMSRMPRRQFIAGVIATAGGVFTARAINQRSAQNSKSGGFKDIEPIRHCSEIMLSSPFTALAQRFREGNYDGVLLHDSGHDTVAGYKTLIQLFDNLPEINLYFQERAVPGKENHLIQSLTKSEIYRASRNAPVAEEMQRAQEELTGIIKARAIISLPTDSFMTPSAWAIEAILKEHSPAVGSADQCINWFFNTLGHGGDIEKAWTQCLIERNEHMASVIADTMKEHIDKKFVFEVGADHLRGEQDVKYFLHKSSPDLKFMEVETLLVKKPSEAGKLYNVGDSSGHFVFTVLDKEKGREIKANRNVTQHGISYILASPRDKHLGSVQGGREM